METFLVTVCPYEMQDYANTGEKIVEGVPMPDDLKAWVWDFVERHHVDEPFVKRRLKHGGAFRKRNRGDGASGKE